MINLRKKLAIFLTVLLIPINVFAYSNYVVLGGQNIGINIENKGVIVIGFYKINGSFNKGSTELKVGDLITKVDDTEITSIKELTKAIENNIVDNKVSLTFIRNDKEYTTEISLYKENNTYKTGLYVKDSIKGIGTISYIDPETKIYGSLGHEIIESNSNTKIDVKTGYIFESSVTGIDKSIDGSPGEKTAKFNSSNVFGTIDKNTIYGIFGTYTQEIDETNLIEVASKEDIKVGKAYIYTVLKDNEIEKFEINITNINDYNKIKNISFEITDERLLNQTGGIVQGMSGSPIVQNNKICGVVTHVVIDKVKTGYGLFITTMLEEGEKNT
jgi:stage IV sporulation protein B